MNMHFSLATEIPHCAPMKMTAGYYYNKEIWKENEKEISKIDSNIYEFQAEITNIHAYVISDFKYGEIWNHMFELVDGLI